jgi:protein SCO1
VIDNDTATLRSQLRRRFRIQMIVLSSLFALSLLAIVLLLPGLLASNRARTLPPADYGPAPAFTLTDQLGRTVSNSDMQGRVVLANFIFTSCTDICPLLSVQMQQIQERLQAEGLLGTEVQLLSFTVDPTVDTPEVLRAYAERHKADPDAWRFLTGTEPVVKSVIIDGFKLGIQEVEASSDSHNSHGDHGASSGDTPSPTQLTHSGRFVIIDGNGTIRAYQDSETLDVDGLVRELRGVATSVAP